jgi:hypothetical protein
MPDARATHGSGRPAPSAGEEVVPRYNAFISYSHAIDNKLAASLRNALHRFAKPWNKRRALNVFLDEASLAANPALWPSIEQALSQSQFFILLASPEGAASPWVAKEIQYWLAHRSIERVLLVVTGGTITWDDTLGDFDRQRTTALPTALSGVFNAEPRWIDLRWVRKEEQLSLRHPDFRNRVADLAAPIHGRPKEDLIGEDVLQHKRTIRLRNFVIAGLSALTLGLAIATGAAI